MRNFVTQASCQNMNKNVKQIYFLNIDDDIDGLFIAYADQIFLFILYVNNFGMSIVI